MTFSIFSKGLLFLIILLTLNGCKDAASKLSPSGSNGKQVGASAHDLLSNNKFHKINIEVSYMSGFRPTDAGIEGLKNFVLQHTNKGNGVEVFLSEIPASGKSSYSLGDIQSLETTYRKKFNSGDEISVHFLFVDGGYEEANVLGVAYKNTSMCIFEGTIQDNSGDVLQPSVAKLETTVLNHEFGHILGLVDIGSAMQTAHKDSQHGNHCNNTSCLMYYQVETTDFVNNLLNSPVPSLDNNCVNDLTANGGK